MISHPATKNAPIAGEPMGRFQVGNCLAPRRLTAMIEKFLREERTGNVRLNIKDGKILGNRPASLTYREIDGPVTFANKQKIGCAGSFGLC